MSESIRVGLFVPCYVDQLWPDVGLATLELLEDHGAEVEVPDAPVCCGQPLVNAGSADAARPLALQFAERYRDFPYVVAPSGSCVAMLRNHLAALQPEIPELAETASRTYELCEFLFDVVGARAVAGRFPHRVGLHPSCHGLRELRLAAASERSVATPGPPDKVRELLGSLDGIELTDPARPDECCGFGGLFSVVEEAVSCMMGRDRLSDHERAGAEVVTSVDASCLLHLEGVARREGSRLRVLHVAQILAGRSPEATGAG